MQNHEEPDAEPGAACRTPFCKKIEGTADFEVNFLAPEEETGGLFLSYTVVQGTPSVCDALTKSRNEFSQAPQSHKVVLRRLPLKQEPKPNLLYIIVLFAVGEPEPPHAYPRPERNLVDEFPHYRFGDWNSGLRIGNLGF